MSQGSKGQKSSGTGNKKSGAARTGRTPRKQEEYIQDELPTFLRAEVMIIIAFAAALLLFLSNFHLCGVVGDFLRQLQLGLFGGIGFFFPALLFMGASFYLSNMGNLRAVVKLSAVAVAVAALCGFLHMMFGTQLEKGESLLVFYQMSSLDGSGGGLIGGVLSFMLQSVVGVIGTYLVYIAALLICGVCITERSLVKAVKSSSGAAYQYAKEDAVRRRAQRQERLEERRQLREDNVVRGVNFGSTRITEIPLPEETDRLEGLTEKLSEKGNRKQDFEEEWTEREQWQTGEAKDIVSRAQAPLEERVSPADIFSGKIQIPPEYEEPVPFEEDRVKEKEKEKPAPPIKRSREKKTGPLYAERNVMTLEEMEMELAVPDILLTEEEEMEETETEDIWLGEKPSEAIQSVLAERTQEKPEPGFLRDKDRNKEQEQEEEVSSLFVSELTSGPELTGTERVPADDDFYLDSEDDAYPELDDDFYTNSAPERVLISAPEREKVSAPERAIISVPEQKMTPMSEQAVISAPEQERVSMSGWEQEEEPAGTNTAPEDRQFAIREEPKRVVTASGKVIETETEQLKKRIEQKREEAAVVKQERVPPLPEKKPYVFPPVTLLKKGNRAENAFSEQGYKDTAIKLQQTLRNFGVGVTVTNISCGPSVTRYELHPEQGVKVSKIVGLADDIKLSLAAAEIRIEAPIPGKSAVGIEVPNKETSMVYLRDLLESDGFLNSKSRLTFAVGKDIGGQPVMADIAKMPHLLIAGATGSGKSVCINTLIMSIIFKADPEEVKLIMVDPKVVELSVYNGIPHLLIPVVTDPKKASGALNWAVAEMEDRYRKFAEYNVRNLQGYNDKIKLIEGLPPEDRPKKMPQIVIIIDELADLMMVVPGEVEDAICRLAQLARAAGIHLVIATQRPSVNVITGLIKANVPSRIAFAVSSGVDSRTIIDMNGAEKLLGKGDMLFFPSGIPKPQRVQGAFISDSEVSAVVEFLTEQGITAEYSSEVENRVMTAQSASASGGSSSRDEYFFQAGKFIIEKEKASIGMLQRVFKIGFNRAARIMDQLAEAGVVGEEEGTKPRKVLMTLDEFEQLQ